ncbi:MAG: NAD(P)H-hydrate dehydratase [Bacteroidales bacterium]|nr:NAD(P)H-hydrate dehydratase [Bacteroidales bacterium]
MKIFRCEQIRLIDEYTIKNEPVAPVDLMERAAGKLYEWYSVRFERSRPLMIFSGPGNNGGDSLALARLLARNNFLPQVFYVETGANTSDGWKNNRTRLEQETTVPFISIERLDQFPRISKETVIIDGLFGSGLERPVEGLMAEVIRKINNSDVTVVSIDIPSGLFGEDNSFNNPDNIIRADFTLSFQFPKLSFMFPENEIYTGEWSVLDIGLHPEIINETETPCIFMERSMIKSLIKQRNKFDHKGIFGHALLTGGSYGRMGAVILGAKAALRTGTGLLTCHIPSGGNFILQCSVPEAMLINDNSERIITGAIKTDSFSAVGIGPGMGTDPESFNVLYDLITKSKKPLVIDADGLNILSENKNWLQSLSGNVILTPHPREFERLAGKSANGYERLMKQIGFSAKYNCILVLKGAHTSISSPGGQVCFNSTGNPGMATAGSGDVLTGMILSLLAQGYDPLNAALAGVFLHGLAGDKAAERSGLEAVIASDIIEAIGEAYNRIRK